MTPADFKTIRESLGLSAQWLADAVHVDQRTVRRWEDGALPLRADVVELLTRLDENVATDVERVLADISIGEGTDDLDRILESLGPEDWPAVEVPRVDSDVNVVNQANALLANLVPGDVLPLPAAFYRAMAGRLRWELGGRLHITYRRGGIR